ASGGVGSGPPRAWESVDNSEATNYPIFNFFRSVTHSMSAYADAYARSMADPQSFWLEAADAIDWFEKPHRALDTAEAPIFTWFPDGVLNTCYNALGCHVVQANGD